MGDLGEKPNERRKRNWAERDWIDLDESEMVPDDYRHVMPDGTVLTKEDLEGSWADIARRRREREGSDEAD